MINRLQKLSTTMMILIIVVLSSCTFTATEKPSSTLENTEKKTALPAFNILASLIKIQYQVQKERADNYLLREDAVPFPVAWPDVDTFLNDILNQAAQKKLPPLKVQDQLVKLKFEKAGAIDTMKLFLAFQSTYFNLVASLSESHPFYPINTIVDSNEHCCAILMATLAYRLSIEFTRVNTSGLSIELRSPYPRRVIRMLLDIDKNTYNYYLGRQLDIISSNQELADHQWSVQFMPQDKKTEAALYYPFITRKICINCHLSSVREMQDNVLFAASLEELVASRISGSLVIPKEPALNEILGVFVMRMKQSPNYTFLINEKAD